MPSCFFKDNYLEEITGEIEGMRVTSKKVKANHGFKLYGLTNWSDTIYRVMEKFDIFQLLDGVVISCEEHFIKPEKEIYFAFVTNMALNRRNVCLRMTELVNVLGAKAIGMEAVLFTTPKEYIFEIEANFRDQN